MAADPICTDPDKYQVIFENERVRVLEYHDRPGDQTTPHRHPDSVMVTLSGFRRRHTAEVHELRLKNTGTTPTHVLFVELKEDGSAAGPSGPAIGPA